MERESAQIWRNIIRGSEKSWVLFKHETCVIFPKPIESLENGAIELMKEYGPVHVGSPAGDFTTIKLINDPGWVVAGHQPDILTYVSPAELGTGKASDVAIGLAGRSKRDLDAKELHVVHVEDKRQSDQHTDKTDKISFDEQWFGDGSDSIQSFHESLRSSLLFNSCFHCSCLPCVC